MQDYKNSKIADQFTASQFISGLCFGAVFYGVIFLLMII